MQHASASTVLGDFDNVTVRYNGIVSTFFTRDGKFFVNTDGPDGKLADFEIVYTFGLYPLQQYLVGLPGRPNTGTVDRLGCQAQGTRRCALVSPVPT